MGGFVASKNNQTMKFCTKVIKIATNGLEIQMRLEDQKIIKIFIRFCIH